jgi:hypothetical protein
MNTNNLHIVKRTKNSGEILVPFQNVFFPYMKVNKGLNLANSLSN